MEYRVGTDTYQQEIEDRNNTNQSHITKLHITISINVGNLVQLINGEQNYRLSSDRLSRIHNLRRHSASGMFKRLQVLYENRLDYNRKHSYIYPSNQYEKIIYVRS